MDVQFGCQIIPDYPFGQGALKNIGLKGDLWFFKIIFVLK
jgi:hypothetical protein